MKITRLTFLVLAATAALQAGAAQAAMKTEWIGASRTRETTKAVSDPDDSM
jgi:hypothetical protein